MSIYSSSSQITPLCPLQIIWQASRVPFHAKLWLLNFDMRLENLDISIQQPEMKRCSAGIKCICVYVVVCLGYLFVLYLFRFFLCSFFFVCVSLCFSCGWVSRQSGPMFIFNIYQNSGWVWQTQAKICLTQKGIQMPMMLPHCCVKKKKKKF